MDDKMFDLKLLTKMYSEFSVFRTQLKEINRTLVNFENDMKPKIEAALDGYQQVYEKLTHHDKVFDKVEARLDNIEYKVTEHEVKIKVVK